MTTYEEAILEIENLKRQLAESKAEITFLKTEMIVLGNGYRRTEYKTCKLCENRCHEFNPFVFNPYKKGAPYCRKCMMKLYGDDWEYVWLDMMKEKYNKEKPGNVFEYEDEEDDVEEYQFEEDQVEEEKEDEKDEDEKDEDEDDEEEEVEEEEVEDRRQTHTVKEPWKSMMTEFEEREEEDNINEAAYIRKECDENGQEYNDECWYEPPIKTITVKQMMLALDKLPRNAQLVITEDGYYSDTEFAKMMLPEPYTIKNKIPRLPDGTQVYRIGHSYQHYGKQYWEKYWEK
jgi:chemotaxis protein histidine kinase CheA